MGYSAEQTTQSATISVYCAERYNDSLPWFSAANQFAYVCGYHVESQAEFVRIATGEKIAYGDAPSQRAIDAVRAAHPGCVLVYG